LSNIKPFYCYAIIAAVSFLVYYNSLNNDFVFDDDSVILSNTSIQNLSNIPRFFTAEEGFHKVIGRYYRPIVSASYAIDYYFWKLDPYGYHLTNIVIHVICCLLLFKILNSLFWRFKFRNLFSLLASLIFAVHPIHTEAVTWVSGRTDSMVTMFFFASFLCYILFTQELEFNKKDYSLHRIENKNYSLLILCFVFYILGLLTKEMIVTMPVIIILYDFVFRKKDWKYFKTNLYVYILFAIITILYLALRFYLLRNVPERENYFYFIDKDWIVVTGTMLKTIPVYLRLLFIPFPLLYHYNGVILDAKTMIDIPVILSMALIALMLFLAFYFYKRDSIISFCILFFFVTLLPVLNIIPTMSLMAERFLYIVSFALVLLVCYMALRGSAKRDFSILTIGIIVIICLLSYLTYARNEDWKNNDTLYLSAKGTEGIALLVNIANIYSNAGKYDEAKELYKRAIELREKDVLAHHNLGLVYLIQGSIDSAKHEIQRGIFSDSLAPDGYFQMANIYNKEGKTDSSILMLEKLQTISPNYRESQKFLAELKSNQSVNKELDKKNLNEEQLKNYRNTLLEQKSFQLYSEKKYAEAIESLKKLLEANKNPVDASGIMNNIAMCYAALKDTVSEEKYFNDALKLDRKNTSAMNGLSGIALRRGEMEKGKGFLKMILSVTPDDKTARNKLDSLNRLK